MKIFTVLLAAGFLTGCSFEMSKEKDKEDKSNANAASIADNAEPKTTANNDEPAESEETANDAAKKEEPSTQDRINALKDLSGILEGQLVPLILGAVQGGASSLPDLLKVLEGQDKLLSQLTPEILAKLTDVLDMLKDPTLQDKARNTLESLIVDIDQKTTSLEAKLRDFLEGIPKEGSAESVTFFCEDENTNSFAKVTVEKGCTVTFSDDCKTSETTCDQTNI